MNAKIPMIPTPAMKNACCIVVVIFSVLMFLKLDLNHASGLPSDCL